MIGIWLLILALILLFLMIPIGILYQKLTFKGRAIIIRETGSGLDVVVDRFKRKTLGGDGQIVVIEFWKYVKEKTPSPTYKFWHKINYSGRYTEEFDRKKLKKNWGDALIFIQTADNQLAPAIIEKGVIKTLDHDNRQFLARHIVNIQKFVKTRESAWKQILLVVAPIFLAILGAVIMWVIFQVQMTENIASICQQSSGNSQGLLNAVQGVVGA